MALIIGVAILPLQAQPFHDVWLSHYLPPIAGVLA